MLESETKACLHVSDCPATKGGMTFDPLTGGSKGESGLSDRYHAKGYEGWKYFKLDCHNCRCWGRINCKVSTCKMQNLLTQQSEQETLNEQLTAQDEEFVIYRLKTSLVRVGDWTWRAQSGAHPSSDLSYVKRPNDLS